MKKILLTGNLGYIGSVMTDYLKKSGYTVIGVDSGLYSDCYLTNYTKPDSQLKMDIRDITLTELNDIYAIVHLAGLSNDPLGDFDENLTYEINYKASIRLATLAKTAGVKRFIYASSQSVYGISDSKEDVTEESQTNPITAYAKSKLMTEKELFKLSNPSFSCTYLRPATAYGASPNLRLDIVLNAFVADAYFKGKIIIKSDGTPWRPMSHVLDICESFKACLIAPVHLVENQTFNVGTETNNYTVRELAIKTQEVFPNAKLVFTGEHIDSRSYRVSSSKILNVLKDYYKPTKNIDFGIKELLIYFQNLNSMEDITESYKTKRLMCLKQKVDSMTLKSDLRFR
jgi:nucleoside-diphosphate-sugar epimerase